MARKGDKKNTAAVPKDRTGIERLANEPAIKKRGQDFSDAEDMPVKKAKNNDPPQRSPLPKRRGRNEDPVGKRAKAAKAAENKAAKDMANNAKEVEKQQKAAKSEAAKEKLAKIEANESVVLAQEQQHRIRRRSNMKARTRDGNNAESDAEMNDNPEINNTEDNRAKRGTKNTRKAPAAKARVNDGGEEPEADDNMHVKRVAKNKKAQPKQRDDIVMSDSDSDFEMNGDNPGKKGAEEKKKKAKSKLRDEVAARKDEIKSRAAGGARDKRVASGLNTAWLEVQKSTKKQAVDKTSEKIMDDEAALSTRPDFPPSPKFDRKAANVRLAKADLSKRNPSRKNALVNLASEDSNDSDTGALSVAEIRRPTKTRVPSGNRGKQIAKPVDKPRQHKKPTRRSSDASSSSDECPRRAAIMPKGGNSSNLLPSAIASLKGKYLATLYNALYASEEPFDHFTKTSPMFLKTSRQAFGKVWPHLDIEIETDDVLFNFGYQRVLEKRGRIHDAVKASIENYFKTKRYSTSEIVKWVKWFCGTYGSPVFYETPVPQDGIWDASDPDYEKPRGFLKSKFLINIGSRFLQDSEETAIDFGPPRGLFSLSQYEKVIRSYRNGVYSVADFRAKSCNTWIRQYNKNFDKKTTDWWTNILENYVTVSDSEHEKVGDMSILDEGRAALPMSP